MPVSHAADVAAAAGEAASPAEARIIGLGRRKKEKKDNKGGGARRGFENPAGSGRRRPSLTTKFGRHLFGDHRAVPGQMDVARELASRENRLLRCVLIQVVKDTYA